MADNLNNGLYTLLIIVVGAILIAIVFGGIYVNHVRPFLKRREYLIMEMKRSTKKSEYLYWKSKLKDLYISKIPIIRRFRK